MHLCDARRAMAEQFLCVSATVPAISSLEYCTANSVPAAIVGTSSACKTLATAADLVLGCTAQRAPGRLPKRRRSRSRPLGPRTQRVGAADPLQRPCTAVRPPAASNSRKRSRAAAARRHRRRGAKAHQRKKRKWRRCRRPVGRWSSVWCRACRGQAPKLAAARARAPAAVRALGTSEAATRWST